MPEIKQDIRAATFIVAANDSVHKNMADYVCDGTADNVEIQAAIDALPASSGTVHLSEGTFNIIATINLGSNQILEGCGSSTILNEAVLFSPRIYLLNASNSILRDLKLKVNFRTADGSDNYGVTINTCSNVLIENIIIEGTVTTESPWVSTPRWGIAVSLSTGVIVNENYFTNIEYEAISFFNNVKNSVMYANKSYHNGFSYVAERLGTEGNIIANNVSSGSKMGNDILLRNVRGVVVIGNTILDTAGFGIGLDYNARNNIIANNYISNTTYGGISFAYGATHNLVIGNTIRKVTTVGIHIDSTSHNNKIQGNLIVSTNSDGVQINSTYNVIESNVILYAGAYSYTAAIRLQGALSSYNTVKDNVIRTPYAWGIAVYPENGGDISIENFIQGNDIRDLADTITATLTVAAAPGATTLVIQYPGRFEVGLYILIGAETVRITNVTTPDDTYTPATLTITPAIAGNYAIGTPITGVKRMARGIYLVGPGTRVPNYVISNIIQGAITKNIDPAGEDTTTTIRGNIGYVTENSGTATITGAVNTVVVNHGLVTTPTRVLVTALQTGQGDYAVTARGATTFTITFVTQPGGSTWTFDWRAQVGEG